MNPTAYEIGVTITLASMAIALVALFLYYKASATKKRMQRMLLRLGLDPNIVTDANKKTVLEGIRQRCKKCQTEDVCERWLAGKLEGDNDFCPNAEIIEILVGRSIRSA